MASVNQAKFLLFIFCIIMVMQTSACETRRQARIQQNDSNTERTISSEK